MLTATSWVHIWLYSQWSFSMERWRCGTLRNFLSGRNNVSGKINKQPPGDWQACCCIPSVLHCICLGLPALLGPGNLLGYKTTLYAVLCCQTRQGRLSSQHVPMPKTYRGLMGLVDRASPEVHTCSILEQALGTLSKNFPCPALAFPTAVWLLITIWSNTVTV